MKVLLSGGNDTLQRSVGRALVTAQYGVRLLIPAAQPLPRQLAGLEPFVVDLDDERGLESAARGCDAAIAIDGAASRTTAPEQGVAARAVLAAAARVGTRRTVHVTTRPGSPPGDVEWLTLRPTLVYGIADDPITLLLIMMRSLPAVPVPAEQQPFAPLWHEDLAQAIAASLSLPPAAVNRLIDLAGPESIAPDALYDRIAGLIGRRPLRLPIPRFIAQYGASLTEALRVAAPLPEARLGFAQEAAGGASGLSTVFGIAGTAITEGLHQLIRQLEEVTPIEGVGSVEVKRFWADIRDGRYTAADLLDAFRMRFAEVMPIPVGVEPAAPATQLTPGAVLTMALPGRGHVQIRVEEVSEDHVVVATLRGHAVAGIVRFRTEAVADGVRFEVMTGDAAANALDWITLTLGGSRLQDANWTRVVQNVVALSGGSSPEVQTDQRRLSAEEAADLDRAIRAIIGRQQAA